MSASLRLITCLGIVTQMSLISTKSNSSPYQDDILRLLPIQRKVTTILQDFLKTEEERLLTLKKLYKKFDELNQAVEDNATKCISNPVFTYLLVKSLTTDLNSFLDMVTQNSNANVFNGEQWNNLSFPDTGELAIATYSLIWLHATSESGTTSAIEEYLNEIDLSNVEITANDYYKLGRKAYEVADYKNVIYWMEKSYSKLCTYKNPNLSTKVDIMERIAFSHIMDENITAAFEATQKLLKLMSDNDSAKKNVKFFLKALSGKDQDFNDGNAYTDYDEFVENLHEYRKLCRGELDKSVEEQSQLFCRFFTNDHPYLFLQPVKEEEVNLHPRVLVYHNVILEDEIEIMKELSGSKFENARVYSTSEEDSVAEVRVSKSAWVRDKAHVAIRRLSRRIEDITGLNSRFAETYQVAHYGIGGFYRLHPDFISENQMDDEDIFTGNRIATWLSYINHVEAGGFTVFPALRAAIKPEKGSAVFWYNLYRNGTGNYDTIHAACPVLKGTKWIANKWFREKGHEFLKPCTLNQFE